jgi:AraC-like DNA-binding protein
VARAEGLMLPVQRFEMITDDLDLSATIGHLYARHRPRVRRIARTRVNGGLRAASAGPLNAGLVRMVGFEYEAQADPVDWLLTAVISTGTVAVTAGREQAAVARSGALLFPLGAQFAVVGRSAAAVALRIPLEAAADLAEEDAGLPAAELRFESMGAVSATACGLFTRAATFICGELVTSGVTAVSPLIVQELTRLAASTMLTAFPNTTMTIPYLRGPGQVPPVAARRAAEFIEGHACQPLTLAGIAAQAGVTPRALQHAFRRHYDTAPMSYLRQVRLQRAHQDLLAGDPAAGDTVAAIARRWGFSRPDRFADVYQAAYGRPPSHTLLR